MKKKYKITGMSCAACAAHVSKAVNDLDGYTCNVSLLTNSMEVNCDNNIDDQKVIEAVSKAGYGASIYKNEYLDKQTKKVNYKKVSLFVSIGLMILIMYLAMGHMINALPPFLSGDFIYINVILQIVLTSLVIGFNFHYFTSGFSKLFKLKPNMDTLVALGSSISFIYSLVNSGLIFYHCLTGGFEVAHELHHNHLYFDSASMILTLVSVGKYLEGLSKKKTTKALDELMEMVPESVLKYDGKTSELVSIESIQIDDIIEIRPYDVIPLDGEVIDGSSYIDDSSITGESLLKEVTIGDSVISGSKNQQSTLYIKVKKTAENSTINQIIKMVEQASSSKMKIEKLVDKVALIFVPFVIIVAILVFGLWMIISKGTFNLSLRFAISVLVISCPCALGLATPLCVMVATLKASKNFILVKDAEVYEQLAKVDVVMFDKTGTITNGQLKLVNCTLTDDQLYLLQSLENNSNHPLAKELCKDLTSFLHVTNFETVPGKGISGVIKNVKYFAGNAKYLKEINGHEESNDTYTVIYFFTEKEYLGKVEFSDSIKDTSTKALELFKNRGLKTVLLTGDNDSVAKKTCESLKIDDVHASLLPQDKAEIIKQYQQDGHRVLMIGDGINDSVALELANVGMAMNETNIAKSSADIVLTRSDLLDAYNAYHLSIKTVRNIKLNLFWAFFYNIIAIPIAAGALYEFNIALNPMIAAAAMSLSSICVCLNALRLNLTKMEKEEKDSMTFYVKDMMCNHCVAHVKDALNVEGVKGVEIDLPSKKVVVDTTLSKEQIFALVKKAGYQPTDE